jgi:hypothetical protein
MGNRALIVFKACGVTSPAISLHWNGGPESVYAFIDALGRYGVRVDANYEAARFIQIAGNFLGGTLSVGVRNVDRVEDLECEDSGVYVIERAVADPGMPWHTTGVRHIRRRIGDRWLTAAQVDSERQQAYRHPYHVDDTIAAAIDLANRHKGELTSMCFEKRNGPSGIRIPVSV